MLDDSKEHDSKAIQHEFQLTSLGYSSHNSRLGFCQSLYKSLSKSHSAAWLLCRNKFSVNCDLRHHWEGLLHDCAIFMQRVFCLQIMEACLCSLVWMICYILLPRYTLTLCLSAIYTLLSILIHVMQPSPAPPSPPQPSPLICNHSIASHTSCHVTLRPALNCSLLPNNISLVFSSVLL